MPAVAYKKNEVEKIINLLPYNQQVEIAEKIIQRNQLKLIEEWEKSYIPEEEMSMEEIVAITKEVRRERNAKKK